MSLIGVGFAAFTLARGLAALLLVALALGTATLTLLATFGTAPWLDFNATFGTMVLPEAGMVTQIGITLVLVSLLFYLPASARILRLEAGHRSFDIRMEDVARAYHLCHTADRAGAFTMSSEFDAVRERLAYLRDHPDLERLEPDVLQVAAQMSQQARHLADVYSDDKVERARDFLRQRQQEAERQQERIVEAQHAMTEIRKWAQQVELEESVVASQLARLEEHLVDCMPALGYRLEKDETVVTFAGREAAE